MHIKKLWGRPRGPDSEPDSSPAHGRLVIAGAWTVVLVAWAIAVASVVVDRHTTLRHAENEMTTLTRAYAEHVSKTLQGADQALRMLRNEYRRLGLALDIRAMLKDGEMGDADIHQMGVIAADGFISHSSLPFTRVDLGDREHFRVHVGATADRLFVSKPVLGKVTGKWSIQLSRRIQDPDGRFRGVAVVSVPPSLFSSFFQRTSAGNDAITTLTGLDGIIRARSPDDQGLGSDVSKQSLFRVMTAASAGEGGVSRQVSAVDGIERLWAFRTLKSEGLFVISGRPMAGIMAPWQARSAAVCSGALLFTFCVLGLATVLRRHMRRQERLVAALRAGAAQLRQVVDTMVEGSTQVASAGATMSVSAQTLAIRTDQQGDQLTVASGRVREVVGQVQTAAAHVGSVDTRCTALREQTRSGMAVVARGVEAIEGIAARTREMRETVGLIEAIAFQTNILALNAAVEAARAGDAGRAFAVVAAEVRDLASRSHQSAQHVRELIARATEQAGIGVRESQAVRAVLEGIAGGVEAVADEMRAVSAEARHQGDSLQRVLGGLDDLASLTRTNADMVAESVMAAEDMREHAQRLRQVVADIERDIQVGGSPDPSASPPPVPAGQAGAEASAREHAGTVGKQSARAGVDAGSPGRDAAGPRAPAPPKGAEPAEATGVEFF